MSNVQIQISNVDVTEVFVQTLSGEPVTSLAAGESDWFAVSEGGEVSVQANIDGSQMTVKLGYAGPGSQVSMSSSSITIDLYSSPVYVQATTAMTFKLQGSAAAALAGTRYHAQRAPGAAAADVPPAGAEGVKCGEIIIYPPA